MKFKPYTKEFLELILLKSKRMPFPTFLEQARVPRDFNPIRDWPHVERTLIGFWWSLFKRELLEIRLQAALALAYLHLSQVWKQRPSRPDDSERSDEYRWIGASRAFGYWILNSISFFEHVLYFLDDRTRASLSRSPRRETVLNDLARIGAGTATSKTYPMEDLAKLRRLLEYMNGTERRYLRKLWRYRDVRAHRYALPIDSHAFPFSVKQGKATGYPIVTAPGEAFSITSQELSSLVPVLWRRIVETLRRVSQFQAFRLS
jgi:hypothetical protein